MALAADHLSDAELVIGITVVGVVLTVILRAIDAWLDRRQK